MMASNSFIQFPVEALALGVQPDVKADSATLAFYASKDGKFRVTCAGRDDAMIVLEGQRPRLGPPQRVCPPIVIRAALRRP